MLYVGTSGWQYRHWRDTFYPREVAQARWLEHYVERFQTVELNNSFYMLPSAATFDSWRRRAPDDFVFAVKASRLLTHMKRLKDVEQPLERFLERATRLGSKLGPVLLQLPPRMAARPDRLQAALSLVPRRLRVAVEFRNDSWYTADVRTILERREAALCWADSPVRRTPAWRTAPWGFVRFHHGLGRPQPCYPRSELERWSERIARTWEPDEDVFAYFNNDPLACALRDAIVFAGLARADGLRPTRVPHAAEVRVGGG